MIAFAPVTVTNVLLVDPVSAVTPDKFAPFPTKLVAVITPAFPNFILLPTSNCPPLTLIPVLNVPIPNESTFGYILICQNTSDI